MKRVLASVEGQTEEAVAIEFLQPHLVPFGVWFQPVIVETKRLATGYKYRGGLSSWGKADNDIRNLIRDSSASVITTMFDLYGLPADTPGLDEAVKFATGQERALHIEAAIADTFDDSRFEPYLSVHELEALTLAAPSEVLESRSAASRLANVQPVLGFSEPEEVNEENPPSERLQECWPDYAKSIDGPAILAEAGVDWLRQVCPHFSEWLTRLEALPASDV